VDDRRDLQPITPRLAAWIASEATAPTDESVIWRASPYVIVLEHFGTNELVEEDGEIHQYDEYRCKTSNDGQGDAWDVMYVLFDSEDEVFHRHAVGEVPAKGHGGEEEFWLSIPMPHPALRSRIEWRDLKRHRTIAEQGSYPAASS
jgi:hypothetical protein